jgi:hypothetical protein
MRALLRAGRSATRPARRQCDLAACCRRGRGRRDAVAFAEAIENVGGELAAAQTEHAVGAGFSATLI